MQRKSNSWLLSGVLVTLFIGVAPRADSQSTPQRSLLALSKHEHTLAIVDPTTLRVIARLPVGPDPHEVIASADGTKAYVSIYGFGRYHALSVLDLVAPKALPDIDTGALTGPHGLAFVGGKVWFTAEGAKAIARIDPATGAVDWIMGTGQNRTHMSGCNRRREEDLHHECPLGDRQHSGRGCPATHGTSTGNTPPARRASTARRHTSAHGLERDPDSRGQGRRGFDISPDGAELWTANAQDGSLSIIDLRSRKVAATLDAKIFASNRLKFTPDGKRVLISSLRDGDLVIYDAASRQQYKRVRIGHGAAGILTDSLSGRAFVACTRTTTSRWWT